LRSAIGPCSLGGRLAAGLIVARREVAGALDHPREALCRVVRRHVVDVHHRRLDVGVPHIRLDSEISDEERQTLRYLEALKESAVRHFDREIESDQTDAAPVELSRKELEEVERSRRALFEAAAAGVLGIQSGDAVADGGDA
jgi:hypothetical protein